MSTGGPIVGIDLGTTNSVVAHANNGSARILTDASGYKIQPSVVSFHPNGGVLVGSAAKQRRIIDAENTIYSAKRLIGRTFTSKEVTAAMVRVPFKIKEGVNQQPVIATRAGEFAIPEISAIVIDHMRSIARTALDEEIQRAIVTVPANFTDAQRSATATAGAIAGVTVVRVMNEPTAAALAYGHSRSGGPETIAVYDFGGGTFDVSVLKLNNELYEVLSTAGDSFLGGDDLDERLVGHMVQQFLREHRVDLQHDITAMQRLRAVAEQTKIELSRRSRAIVKVDELAYGPGGSPLDLEVRISREEFLAQIAPVVDRTFPVCQAALDDAGLHSSQIDEVVLVGGTTKMPYVRERVAAFFGSAPRTDVNPDEAVALGAAIQAEAMARVLGGTPRPTMRSAVAPPAPPMETRPQGGPKPPPPPADAIARKLAPGPRVTRPRVATRNPIEPFEGRAAMRGTASFGSIAEQLPGADNTGDEEPTNVAESRPVPAPKPGAAAPPPVPGTGSPGVRRVGTPLARVTKRGAVPSGTGDPAKARDRDEDGFDANVPTARVDPFAVDTSAGTVVREGASEGGYDQDETVERPPYDPDTEVADAEEALAAEAQAGGEGPAPDPVDLRGLVSNAVPVASGRSAAQPVALNSGRIIAQPPAIATSSTDAAEPVRASTPAPTVLDVVPQTLGIGTVAGFCDEILHRNTQIPCEQTRSFATSQDGQLEVRLRICQGESRRIADNTLLGEVVLSGLDPKPRGRRIEVTFRIGADGMLEVAARDQESGVERQASVNLLGAQSSAEVDAARERMQRLRPGS